MTLIASQEILLRRQWMQQRENGCGIGLSKLLNWMPQATCLQSSALASEAELWCGSLDYKKV